MIDNVSKHELDFLYSVIKESVLVYQNPITGLFPSGNPHETEHNTADKFNHAWIRDNVYISLSVWSMSMAFKNKPQKSPKDNVKIIELDGRVIKCMRGLLICFMRQRKKIEKFIESHASLDSIHSKFSCETGFAVTGDNDWGHLQIDAISLFLLIVAQLTVSGLIVISSLEEVALVQHLIFYIESAYSIADFGMWERGDKTNTGICELNASSIGMAKAAMNAMNNIDLFGDMGCQAASVIHVNPDEVEKCNAILESMLPRESISKETDASLLTIIGYPAFAVQNYQLVETIRENLFDKLIGRYGMKRFQRDGFKTALDDGKKLFYHSWELSEFEGIECEWPIFYSYIVITAMLTDDIATAQKYHKALNEIVVDSGKGYGFVPEIYTVPVENIENERIEPGSQERVVAGRVPFLWAQSLYLVEHLLMENHISIQDLDPFNKRSTVIKNPQSSDVIVQVAVLAQNNFVQQLLDKHGISCQTISQVAPIQVHPARILSHLYTFLGKCDSLGLGGKKKGDMEILATSQFYRVQNQIFIFTPHRFDFTRNYMYCDPYFMMTTFEFGLYHLTTSWISSGLSQRPTVALILDYSLLDKGEISVPIRYALNKLRDGYIYGTRVILGNLSDFVQTSYVTDLGFLNNVQDGKFDQLNIDVERYLKRQSSYATVDMANCWQDEFRYDFHTGDLEKDVNVRKLSIHGALKRSRSSRNPTLEEKYNLSNTIQYSFQRQPSIIEEADIELVKATYKLTRNRRNTDCQFSDVSVEELFQMFIETSDLDERGDIVHFLTEEYGIDFTFTMNNKNIVVRDLVRNLYTEGCSKKCWGIIRHCAGLLGNRFEDLSKAVTDLLVKQKQLSFGIPPNEETISSPLTSHELKIKIREAYPGDASTVMLTQEVLVYLSMMIVTEPKLFHGMLRFRIGLIIQVIAAELQINCVVDYDQAIENLMNLKPSEIRNLLVNLMSGTEVYVQQPFKGVNIICDEISKAAVDDNSSKEAVSYDTVNDKITQEMSKVGCWIRRRRLDGALNRVPLGFYSRIWHLMAKCESISIHGKCMRHEAIKEMTSGEMKFALMVEGVLNTVPEPEFRQMLVETLTILSMVVQYNIVTNLSGVICVENIIHVANKLFLQDQFETPNGVATICCATKSDGVAPPSLKCGGVAGICQYFYDSAPSGSFGTLSYLVRATCIYLEDYIPVEGEMQCKQM